MVAEVGHRIEMVDDASVGGADIGDHSKHAVGLLGLSSECRVEGFAGKAAFSVTIDPQHVDIHDAGGVGN